MSNYKIYKMTLSPTDWFFFGGEITYGGSDTANYYAKSRLFPQESSILGMLRYEILKKEGLLNNHDESIKTDVINAIGETGFDCLKSDSDISMGKIKQISPVMLQYKDYTYYPAPFNYGLEVAFLNRSDITTYINEEKSALPFIENFNIKEYYNNTGKWLSLQQNNPIPVITTEQAFMSKTKIGISKQKKDRDKDNKEGYYKGDYFKLNKDYHFVFYAQLDIELDSHLLVNLGAERSMFIMSLEEQQSTDNDFFIKLWINVPTRDNQITFLSEAFVPESISSYCSFAWSDTISFRYITRPWKAGRNYASLDKKTERSQRFNLLKRGSVLYYSTPQQYEKIIHLINNPYLQKLGYNIYK